VDRLLYFGQMRSSSHSSYVIPRWVVAAGALVLAGCNLGQGFADFGKDVFEPDPVFIDGSGHRIAEGEFAGMLLDPWGEAGSVIVAFRHEDDGPHLRMQPFEGGPGCDVGPAQRCIVFNKLDDKEQLIAYVVAPDANGRGTLKFTNHQCETVSGSIDNALLPSDLFDSPPGYLVDAGGQLLIVSPWDDQISVLAADLRSWSGVGTEGSPIWFVDGGQFVLLDASHLEVVRTGTDVTQVVGSADPQADEIYLIDGGNLVVYRRSTGDTQVIAEDACQVTRGADYVTYLSPCAERRLIAQDLATHVTEQLDVGVGRSLNAQRVRPADDTSVGVGMLYTKPSVDSPGFEDLWLKRPDEDPRLWEHRLGRLVAGTAGTNPTLLAIVDSDGQTGRLVRADADSETTLHDSVAVDYPIDQASSPIALVDFDGTAGNLTRIDGPDDTTVLASNVPLASEVVSPATDYLEGAIDSPQYLSERALVYNVDSWVGTLGIAPEGEPFVDLAEGVPLRYFRFFRRMAAIGYLDQWDAETGTGRLSVHQTDLGATSHVSDHVLEFAELLWPYEGVLYTVRDGDRTGVWVARAK